MASPVLKTSPSEAPPGRQRPRLGWPTILLFGSGAMANTIKARGLSTFLMIFYNQVLGLNPATVGLATSIALIFDAIIDPTIGQISDNVRTPWGRRHPFMYAAAAPVAIAFFMLWNPPTGWEGAQLFGYMLACLLTIRLFDTFFELPSTALLPELEQDYHRRTTLISVRNLFGILGAFGMNILVLTVLMPDTNGRHGILARDGYFSYSILCAVIIFTMILVSTAATHRFIPFLRQAPVRTVNARIMTGEIFQTLRNHAFMVATLSGVFTAVAGATRAGMELYFGRFFWGFNQGQLAGLQIAALISATGLIATPSWSRWLGKKWGAIWAYAIALAIGASPIALRLAGIMPPNGHPMLYPIIFVETIANGFFAIMTGVLLTSMIADAPMGIAASILVSSMIADVVEDSELRTGKRSEGLFFSAAAFVNKAISGMGVLGAGVILFIVSFPAHTAPGQVSDGVLRNLALAYVPVTIGLYLVAVTIMSQYRISKDDHEANLRKLAEDETAAAEVLQEERGPGFPKTVQS